MSDKNIIFARWVSLVHLWHQRIQLDRAASILSHLRTRQRALRGCCYSHHDDVIIRRVFPRGTCAFFSIWKYYRLFGLVRFYCLKTKQAKCFFLSLWYLISRPPLISTFKLFSNSRRKSFKTVNGTSCNYDVKSTLIENSIFHDIAPTKYNSSKQI